ncbi:MFS transporter, partial [Rhizobium ruizarguesonis]
DRPGLGSALNSVNIFASAGNGALNFAAGTYVTGYSGTSILSAVTGLSGIAIIGILHRGKAR